jgi:hypothetical protein
VKSIIKAIGITLGIVITLVVMVVYLFYVLVFPSSRFVVKVVDEAGNPIKGIPVELEFEHSFSTGNPIAEKRISTTTDSSGVVSGSGWADEAVYIINVKGFYKSIADRSLVDHYETTCKTVLKTIDNPKPMYAKNMAATIPSDGKAYSYDLMLGDWLPPLGHGVTPDIVFTVTAYWKSVYDYKQELTLSFSNPDDGIQPFVISFPDSGSVLRLPKKAPTSGYMSQWKWKKDSQQDMSSMDRPMINRAFFFRVRSSRDNTGTIKGMYGKISHDVDFGIDWHHQGMDIKLYGYYLNPDGTTTMEFDTSKNIFTLKWPQAVVEP